jgi:hypothetical protein
MAYRKTSGKPGSTRMAMSSLMEKNPRDPMEVGDELLSNIGRQVLDLLRAGGKRLDNMDRAYVDKLNINPHKQPLAEMTRGVPIGDIYKYIDGESQTERLAQQLVATGAMGTNLAARYGLPAGAAVLGAKGLADITNGIYDEASNIPIM